MESLILHNIDRNELTQIISSAVSDQLQNLTQSQPKPKRGNYLTRVEASKILRISLPTLRNLTKAGIVKGYRLGGRVLYKSNELDLNLIENSKR